MRAHPYIKTFEFKSSHTDASEVIRMMRLNKEGQLLRVFLLSLLTSIVTIALYAFVENETISAIFLRIACPAVICCLVTGLFLLATVLARPFKGIPEAKWAVSLVLEALTAMPFAVAAIRDSQSWSGSLYFWQ